MSANSATQSSKTCFHCGLPVTSAAEFLVEINGQMKPMCCAGCQAVAQAIFDNGLEGFYQHRDFSKSLRPSELIPEALSRNEIYERPALRSRYIKSVGSHRQECTVMLEGLTCAACAWLIEKQLNKQEGILDIEVNYSTLLATIQWDERENQLSEILKSIQTIGYLATPYEPRIQYQQLKKQHSEQLKRIGITAAIGMQIMIISVSLYFGHFYGMEESWKNFFQRLGLLLTLPIMFYSAAPFFKASVNQLKILQPGMDVPVAIGLSLALTASIYTVIIGHGEVYFDSITMFVFLLLLARYFMHRSLLSASHNIERLSANMPLSAAKLTERQFNSQSESVSAEELIAGDWVRVLAGSIIPADGTVIHGASKVNQAIISGESKPIAITEHSQVIAGSLNIEQPIIIEVSASGKDTVFSAIETLTRESQATRSQETPLIDFVARWFVPVVLTVAAVVAIFWWNHQPSQWLAVTVAVLVISCPCALSLSVPTAHACANSHLMSRGLLLTQTQALEQLPKINHLVLDKTGTLTQEQSQLSEINSHSELDNSEALRLAASLEINSDHVLAKPILKQNQQSLYPISDWQQHPGLGLSATIDQQHYLLGSAEFLSHHNIETPPQTANADTTVYLADSNRLLASFHFAHILRQGVNDLLRYAKQHNLKISMLTGDSQVPAEKLAQQLTINKVHFDCKPEDKLTIVKQLQSQGDKVMMIGDGINDSPVLAQADVSIAVSGASPLAVSGAQVIMINPSLTEIKNLHSFAIRTQRVIKQNIVSSISYNSLAIPFAASGFINPLFAAIGMSLSSIVVVLNAQRLRSGSNK